MDLQGFTVVEETISAAEIGQLRDEFDRLEHETVRRLEARGRPPQPRAIAGADRVTFTSGLAQGSALARSFCAGPFFQRSATTCSTATMCGCTASRRCTRSPPQAGSSPGIRYLTCWVALDDATGENGCPWFVPGLFRRGPLLHRFDGSNGGWTISGLRSEDAVCVPVKAGSVAVF